MKKDPNSVKEKVIEDYFCEKAKKAKFYAVKIIGVGTNGVSDRLLGAKGLLFLVELKRPKGGIVSGWQKIFRRNMERVGVKVWLIKTKEEVDHFFKYLEIL